MSWAKKTQNKTSQVPIFRAATTVLVSLLQIQAENILTKQVGLSRTFFVSNLDWVTHPEKKMLLTNSSMFRFKTWGDRQSSVRRFWLTKAVNLGGNADVTFSRGFLRFHLLKQRLQNKMLVAVTPSATRDLSKWNHHQEKPEWRFTRMFPSALQSALQ